VLQLAEETEIMIERQFTDKNGLSRELEKMEISRPHLIEAFIAQYGCTPNEYAAELRLEKAKAQLCRRMFLHFGDCFAVRV